MLCGGQIAQRCNFENSYWDELTKCECIQARLVPACGKHKLPDAQMDIFQENDQTHNGTYFTEDWAKRRDNIMDLLSTAVFVTHYLIYITTPSAEYTELKMWEKRHCLS